jgi:pyruvate dehydrogenase E2 component (dihydrolipoamide acetyltransferase)
MTDESADARDEPAARTVVEERSLGPMRRTISNRLQESYRNAVHVTASREMDAEPLLAAVETAETSLDVDVSLVDVVLLAVARALAHHPAFNATFEDDAHVVYAEQNVGIAVDVDEGLVAPVLADVGSKSLATVSRERRSLTARTLDGDYAMTDLRGGTFTVTNLGPLGVDSFTPIINPPQVAILGVDRLRERAVVGDDGVEARRHLNVDLSFDHRVVDGADAARFLDTLATELADAPSLVDTDA